MNRFWQSLALGVALACCADMTQAWADVQTLDDALALAYQNNPSLAAARARLRATDEQVAIAQSGWRPSVDATAARGAARQKVIGTGTDNLVPRDVGLSVTQPLFRGFRTQASVEEANASVRAERAVLLQTEQQVLFDAARAYLDVVRSQKVLALDLNNRAVLQTQLEATKSRFQVGEVTKTDISQSESRLSGAEAACLKAEGDLANDRATFVRVVGQVPESLTQPSLTFDLPATVDDALAAAERQNPAIVASSFAMDAARAHADFARGSLLPEVSLVGSVSRAWDQSVLVPTRQDDATIMARITVPLYRAGTDYARTRAAGETVTQRRLEQDDVHNSVHELTLQAWQNLKTARAAIEAKKAEIDAADLALHGVREEMKAGTRTTLDALNAEQELLAAKVDLVRAEHDEALARLQIKAVTGTLTAQNLGLKVDLYDPLTHYEKTDGKFIGLGTTP